MILVAVAPLVAGSGCSFLFSEGAPYGHEHKLVFDCGDSVVPPILDVVATGLLALEAYGTSRLRPRPADATTAIAIQAGTAVLDAASATYGFIAVSDCRDAKATRAVEIAQARVLPPPYGAPPYGQPLYVWPPPAAAPPPVAPPPPAPYQPAPPDPPDPTTAPPSAPPR
jgi:hypothetical protein